MNTPPISRLLLAVAALVLAALACKTVQIAPPAPSPLPAAPTMFAPPTLPTQGILPPQPPVAQETSAPTAEMPPTQAEDSVMAQVQDYYEQGYLPYPNGKLTELPDFSYVQPSGDLIHDTKRTQVEVQDFALWADVELNTLGSETRYPNYTGCGFAYRAQGGAGYTAILTNTYVRMGACSSDMRACDLFGTVSGDGKVDVRNKAQTKFALVVNRAHAAVLVDDVLVGKYDLFTTRLLGTGNLYYDAVSNYGAGYWTTCQMTNIKLWESLP